jgi:hypothetical protein
MSTVKTKDLVEYAFTQPKRKLRVDKESGIVFGVKVLGQKSRNGNFYTDGAMQDAAGLYEGVPVYDGHHTRRYSDHVADLHDAYHEGGAVYADLHLRKPHSLYESIIMDAESNPGNLALSHEVLEGNYESTQTPEYNRIEKILKVDAVAIVKTGGTNVSLVEEEVVADTKAEIKTVEQLKASYPGLFEELVEGLKAEKEDNEKLARVIHERDEAIKERDGLQGKLDLIEEEKKLAERKSAILAEAKELKLGDDAVSEDLMEEFVGMKEESVTAMLKQMKPAATPAKKASPESTSGNVSEDDETDKPFYLRGK